MTEEWVRQFGNAAFISRRQNEYAHISTFDELSEIIETTNRYDSQATLVLNTPYSESQLPYIYEILEQWETRGGHSVMLSDMEILLWLRNRKSRLKRHLSVMAGVFNPLSADFFKCLHISRIVLPREKTKEEIDHFMAQASPDLEYEIIVMLQKCEFIDTFCNFYHASHDETGYEGHGCRLSYTCGNKKVRHQSANDLETPACAACSLAAFHKAGITNYKIAGRGYPPEIILKSVRFIRQVLEDHHTARVKYMSTFGNDCSGLRCYYE
jgi:collagenase-like PrtC family protease